MHLQDHDQVQDTTSLNQNDGIGQYSEDEFTSDGNNNFKAAAAANCFARNLVGISDNRPFYSLEKRLESRIQLW